jgi:hypothetical protein
MSKQALEANDRVASYEGDFYLWLLGQAELLRQGRFQDLDVENLAEEVESIGRSDKREVYNRLVVLMVHLLEYQFQHLKRTRSWGLTIADQRFRLKLVLRDSPSLHQTYIPEVLDDIYPLARKRAAIQTDLPLGTFPDECPYALEQLLDEDFLPEAKHG